MESDTATRKARWFRLRPSPDSAYFDDLLDFYWSGSERRISGLTLRIIGMNAIALIMLAVGTIYLGHYQNGLIDSKLDAFRTQIGLVSAALSEQTAKNPEEQARLIKRMSQAMDQRIYLFDENGALIADSSTFPRINEPTGLEQDDTRPRKKLYSVQVLKNILTLIPSLLPDRKLLPSYDYSHTTQAADHPDAVQAIQGKVSVSVWRNNEEHIFLTAAAPLYKNEKLIGAALLARNGQDIEEDVAAIWTNILKIFSVTLLITIILSIYLSGTIAAPLRRLAAAAETMRKGGEADIPDLSARHDEIGELSLGMREMAQALWDRMDSIEHFAADVAHELKNPLASLRSAVETVAIVKDDKSRAQLMEIIAHDIARMDRLISDISGASRLDAELSREAMERVSLRHALRSILKDFRLPLDRARLGGGSLSIRAANNDAQIMLHDMSTEEAFVWGREQRLMQIFENLVSNALSFSPPGGTVHITIVPVKKRVVVTVEDEGPGIPENRLETIFERFYTERPTHEDYGSHSGLGLSICKQIVTALGGQIFAENIKDQNQKVAGARFTVILGQA